ncbi:MAG: mechanosensitive ion channel [Comamonadaceae bacterium]|nr:mechanosensitive ion channel [Comamonadaceae bacterium]
MFRLIGMGLLWLAVGLAQAAVDVPPAQGPAIAAARSALDEAGLTQEQLKAAQAQLEAAQALEAEAEPLAEKLTALRQQAQAPLPEIPAALSLAEQQAQLAQWVGRLPPNLGADALEHLLSEERNASAALKARIEAVTSDLTELISRPSQMPAQLDAVRRRAEASAGEPPTQADEPAALLAARRVQRQAERRRALLELAVYEAEQGTAEQRQRQLEVQLQTLQQDQALRTLRVEWLTQRITRESQQRVQQQARQLAQQAELMAATGMPADVVELAQHNASLAQQLLEGTAQLAQERRTLADYERQRAQIAAVLRDTQARLRLGGDGAAIGPWLWQQRQGMSSLLELRIQRDDAQKRLTELRLRLYSSTEERYALTRSRLQAVAASAPGAAAELAAGVGAASAAWPATAGTTSAASAAPAAAVAASNASAAGAAASAKLAADDAERLKTLQATQADLNDQLEPLLRRRITVLEQTDEVLQALLAQGDELRLLLDQHLLWMPSHQPLGAKWLSAWRMQAGELASLPATLWAAMRALPRHIKARPFMYLVQGLLLLGLLGLRLRAPQRLQAIAQRMRNVAQDSFVYTLQALGWSLLMALPSAVVAWGLGGALQTIGARQAGQIEELGRVIDQMGVPLLFTGLLGAVVRPDGLGPVHLGWSPAVLRALSRVRMIVITLILPAAFFMSLLALLPNIEIAIGTIGRLTMMLMALGLAVLSRPLLRRLPQWAPGANPGLMQVLGWLLPSAFVGAALMVAAGYIMTGIIVLDALLDSMTVTLFVIVIDGLLHRWLLLGERRLTLKRLREQQNGSGGEGSTVVNLEAGEVPPDAESEMALVAVSEQSRRLLRLLRAVLWVLGLLWAWSDVLPALLRLNEVQLWHTTTTGASGKPEPIAVSLMDVLLGGVILLLTFSLVRNLPGLLALAFGASRRISSAMRYTITMLARYAITIVGALLAFSLFGLRWSQLQWMAAALTVGLGFGLQEIFANFVSGLILLVERPFRVGDTITIGSLTGNVTRIRTRATTVLDYDNKEIVIPNKTFITGQVTNWTLSDNVTRQTLNVGVAYGSDPEQVRNLLLRAASEHPYVLKEPAPNAWFMELGNSTLDFELRVYVATIGDRVRVRNDLNQRITQLLSEARIEIAFPQMDLHLRDVPMGWPQQSVQPREGEAIVGKVAGKAAG